MRELVHGLCIGWGVSIRGACGALKFDTSTFHYNSRRTDQAAVARRIKEICETRVRYGISFFAYLGDRLGLNRTAERILPVPDLVSAQPA